MHSYLYCRNLHINIAFIIVVLFYDKVLIDIAGISVPARVPGSIYTDLLNGGILHDPYYRNNSVNYRWVAYESWTFRRSIQRKQIILSLN